MAASRWSWGWLRASPTTSAGRCSLKKYRRWRPSYRKGTRPQSLGSTIAEIRVLRQTDHVCKETERSRNPFGQLAVESVGVVDIEAFAVSGVEQPALLRFLSVIPGGQQCGIVRIPGLEKLRAALLNPTFEVALRDGVGPQEDRIFRIQDIHLGSFIGDFFGISSHDVRVRSKVVIVFGSVVLHDHNSAVLYV